MDTSQFIPRLRTAAGGRLANLEGTLPPGAARALTAGGAVLTIASAFLSWTWTADFPGDLTVAGYPGGLQWLTVTAGLLLLLQALAAYNLRGLCWLAPTGHTRPLRWLALGALATTWFTLGAIAFELGGLANLTIGGWIAGVAVLPALYGTLALPTDQHPAGKPQAAPAWQERLVVTAIAALGLGIFTYGIDTSYGELFEGFLVTVVFTAAAHVRSGLFERISALLARQRPFAMAAAFAAAALFPLTQHDDHNANIGVNILIFATVALGLNIVVGLTGLLDLGYVAFLGVGAYTAALISGSPYSPFHSAQVPFWIAALAGAAVSLVFGVLIGAPTLRLRGDYLAIVTLGFGEIFRIMVNNLDGSSGPKITNGPNGIPDIPDISIFGLSLGNAHSFGPFTIGRFANYFLLMLVVTLIVIAVFSRAGNSRIGRAWIAIREDETAAEAMGINGFRVKLTAFALGAALAGLAGTVSAHVTYNVVPSPYQFAGSAPPNSAFLLAAVVLGGMGTVSGPLLGASLLYLIPEKLEFLQKYQLLAFGVALILLMRFRPEGIVANRRRQLEFHEADIPAQGGGTDTTTLSTAGA
ncbi:branched-chain amino acid transport system permease protein [Kitasatospora sp. MAP12-15]|uniref:branched-chain amino acid ABC transporter permease n=1 Tax=unclassified Kitasatospora TaxID=2633591 RepID=UPI0024756010|nr:branched-chain amino acid ABC transporter permease [Kitasatospora sp. MAP12-44]MDH6109924.1 branched-chain amino acid transport system permease protein [Kitasatospora sp. MAP12-44]